MFKLLATALIIVTMGVMTSTANATVLRLPHKPFNHMTRTEKIHYLKRQKWHDNSIIRWWHNHRELSSAKASSDVKWAQQSLRIVQKNLRSLLRPVVSASSGVISGLLCIHGGEGGWSAIGYVHGVATYFGGLQMDLSFQQTYGPEFLRRWGTANHWPVWAQLQAGVRGFNARGWAPWPNTARACGLY